MSTVAILSQHLAESRKIAEYIASALECPLISTRDLIDAASRAFNKEQKELLGALKNVTAWPHFLSRKRSEIVALLEQKLCESMADNHMVYYGFLGYPLFDHVSHVLKVLILLRSKEGENSPGTASAGETEMSGPNILKWFQKVYGKQLEDPSLYDVTVNLSSRMEVSEVGGLILNTLGQRGFTPTTYSMNCMNSLGLACRVKASLVGQYPELEVKSHGESVYVFSRAFKKGGQKTALDIKQRIMRMEGVGYVEVYNDRALFDNVGCGQAV